VESTIVLSAIDFVGELIVHHAVGLPVTMPGVIDHPMSAEEVALIGEMGMQAERATVRGASTSGLTFRDVTSPLPIHLAFKEFWRNKGRFFMVSLVIALITTLVLFIDGLAEGLGGGNIEYLKKLDADLVLYQENTDLSTSTSRIGWSRRKDIRRVDGVQDVGLIGFSRASIILEDGEEPLGVSFIGVEPGRPGEPPAFEGRQLKGKRSKEAVIGRNVALRTGLQVGDRFTIKSIQGTDEEFYTLSVVGISDGRQSFLQPSVFTPYATWDRIKPQAVVSSGSEEVIFNVAAVQLEPSANPDLATATLETKVKKIEAVDLATAYEATPGYAEQQSTLGTIRIFTLLIGVLVLGGFFQIQTLQKVAQIGMLKAIGASTLTIAVAFVLQIVLTTGLGVAIGTLGTFGLSLGLPPTVPITFTPESAAVAIASLLIIGPMAGMISLVVLLRVEPLTALGLAS
jgi:putative ABC transport system permease protein